MICLVCTIFGVVFAEGALAYVIKQNDGHYSAPSGELWDEFTSMRASALSLFQAMSGVWKNERSHSNFRVFVSCLSA
eukprot:10158659-Heterocapsa_arctica.AAC.1